MSMFESGYYIDYCRFLVEKKNIYIYIKDPRDLGCHNERKERRQGKKNPRQSSSY